MRKSSPQGLPPKPVCIRFFPGLLTGPCVLSYPCRWGNNFTVWHMSQAFLPWHNTAAAVINITWCGPCHLGYNGLFLMTLSWPIDLGWLCVHLLVESANTTQLSLWHSVLPLWGFHSKRSGHLKQCVHQHSKINHTWHLHWASSNNLMRAQSYWSVRWCSHTTQYCGQCFHPWYSFLMHFA